MLDLVGLVPCFVWLWWVELSGERFGCLFILGKRVLRSSHRLGKVLSYLDLGLLVNGTWLDQIVIS